MPEDWSVGVVDLHFPSANIAQIVDLIVDLISRYECQLGGEAVNCAAFRQEQR